MRALARAWPSALRSPATNLGDEQDMRATLLEVVENVEAGRVGTSFGKHRQCEVADLPVEAELHVSPGRRSKRHRVTHCSSSGSYEMS